MAIAKLLVVDDFAPFRRSLGWLLEQDDEIRIVGEASDGLEAVQKVEELQPDLILLDITLPRLNGMEVARRLNKQGSHAKILFLSQQFSVDMVQESLRLAALGYVQKQRAADELLTAIKTVLSGRPFVSSGLNKYAEGSTARTLRHEVVFCSGEPVLTESLTRFIAAAQMAGDSAIVLATKSHLDDLSEQLRAAGLPVDEAIKRGSFIPLEVTEVLSSFMVDGMPDPLRFFPASTAIIDTALRAATGPRPRVVACGEGGGLLLAQGNVAGAIRLEQYWDHLGRAFNVEILCAYTTESFECAEDDDIFRSVCSEHTVTCSR
jgi:DNA-binding NarL/FixJ family response regulator